MKKNEKGSWRKLLTQFVKFGMVGAVNTVLSLVIQWIFLALGFYYQIGNAVAFVITVFISYLLNGYFVFGKESGEKIFSWKALCKVYLSYSVTGLFLTFILLYIWNDLVGINPNISPVINLLFTIPINFLLNKFWAYR